jgi:uncharacterized protein (TIGR00730 family)
LTEREEIIKQELDKNHFRVTIFGSARIKKDDEIYKQVFSLAKEIGKNNIDVVTGGGPGLMEAASAGHHAGRTSTDNHAVGLNIKVPHEQEPNKHLDLSVDFEKFSARLDNFMLLSDVVVVCPGGIGTILELMYTWQLIQVHHVEKMPIILMGEMWRDFIAWIKKHPVNNQFMKASDLDYIYLVDSNEEAIKIILEKQFV